ncbi:kinase-like protein [Teratosphaeria destructans]|uniref:Kinase-like protein n=1 Tax=Teratosphaeria destructans TaxID=418781 RepID=A0A9W7W792_9PEZI|nr:kinase-like protein [Teratosphaeria destructans]
MRSNPQYVAIKILGSTASTACRELAINRTIAGNKAASGHIVRLLDDFRHHGPNGEHLCLVFEPMGPDVATCSAHSMPYWQRRSISKSLLMALQCLHDLKFAHADTNPGNALLSITHPIEEPLEEGRFVSTGLQSKRNPCVPNFIYEDWPLVELWDQFAPAQVKLSDLGAAFPFNERPEAPCIPVALRAPEVVLQSSFGHQVDIWSFACYLFELFTGRPLFSIPGFYLTQNDDSILHATSHDCSLQNDDDLSLRMIDNKAQLEMKDDDHLLQMISTLGPLPPAMFEKWPRRMRYFDASMNIIRSDVAKSDEAPGAIHVGDTLERRLQDNRPPDMTAEDSVDLLSALRSALQYDPVDRTSAGQLLRLKWFQNA